jgi:hypothetical protein
MKTILILNFVIIMFNSCNSGNNIKTETQDRILSHKKFIHNIDFEGTVINKTYCNECNFNKYQIKIKVEDRKLEKIELGNLSFPPYYSILENNEIVLSVNSELYERTKNNSLIKKTKNSNCISIDNINNRLISEKKYQWIPENNNCR